MAHLQPLFHFFRLLNAVDNEYKMATMMDSNEATTPLPTVPQSFAI